MKNALYIALLATAIATPALAQTSTTVTTTAPVAGEQVIAVPAATTVNPDGSVTTTQAITTATDHPAIIPAGIPADAKGHTVTTTTTSVTKGVQVAPNVVTYPHHTTTVIDTGTASHSEHETTTLRVKNPDGTEKVIVDGVESHSVAQ
jgi:hypothetical protein